MAGEFFWCRLGLDFQKNFVSNPQHLFVARLVMPCEYSKFKEFI